MFGLRLRLHFCSYPANLQATSSFTYLELNHAVINPSRGIIDLGTGHEGLEGVWRYSCTLCSTSALDGGGW